MDHAITHEDRGAGGAWVVRQGDAILAELTYSRAGDTLRILDHTDVGDALRGQGVGAKLVAAAVADARRDGIKLMPLCPFAAREFAKHPDHVDVRHG